MPRSRSRTRTRARSRTRAITHHGTCKCARCRHGKDCGCDKCRKCKRCRCAHCAVYNKSKSKSNTKLKSQTKSKKGFGSSSTKKAPSKWIQACRAAGYMQKGNFKPLPAKGSAGYKAILKHMK